MMKHSWLMMNQQQHNKLLGWLQHVDSEGVCGTAAQGFCDIEYAGCNITTASSPYNANAQYASYQSCLAVASVYPRDASGTLANPVTTGDSLECRAYHAGVAYLTSTQSIHCIHSGALGGNGGTSQYCGTPCNGYCDEVMNACNGTNAQFTSTAQCLTFCASYPGYSGMMVGTETTGNSLGCRSYHAGVALTYASTGTTDLVAYHCPHAGILGGSGVCGSACDAYCNTIQAACSATGNVQFSSTAACLTACAAYDSTGMAGAATGNTLQCRQYHAGVALQGDAATQTLHCPHAGANPTAYCVAAGSSSANYASSSAAASLVLVAAAVVAAIAGKQL